MNKPKTIWIKAAKTKLTPICLFFLDKVHYSIEKRERKVKLDKTEKSPIKSPSVPRVSYLGTLFNVF